MGPYTLILLACINGEMKCRTHYISHYSYTSYEICYNEQNNEAVKQVSRLAQTGLFKGRQVVFDMTCVSCAQLREKGIHQVDH